MLELGILLMFLAGLLFHAHMQARSRQRVDRLEARVKELEGGVKPLEGDPS